MTQPNDSNHPLKEMMEELETIPHRIISIVKLASPLAYLIALVATFVLTGLLILLLNRTNPLPAFQDFFSHSFFSEYGILEVLAKSTPIILAGAGMLLAFRCGLWNLGAEGQMAIGAIISSAIGIYLNLPSYVMIPLILLASMIGGALWAGIAGFLKSRFRVNEMLSTLMLNYIALRFLDYMINGPMKYTATNYPRTAEILPQAQLPYLSYPLNSSLFLVILVIPAVWFILNRTTLGYRLKAVGMGLGSAKFAGMDVAKLTIIVMLISGAIAALGGSAEVIGDFYRMERNVTGGYGFTAILALIIGKENIIGLPLATFLVAGMIVGANSLTLAGIDAQFSMVMIGVLLVCVVTSGYVESKLRRRYELA